MSDGDDRSVEARLENKVQALMRVHEQLVAANAATAAAQRRADAALAENAALQQQVCIL